MLERLAEITEKQQALKNRMQASLAYPIFMLCFGVLVLFILLTYIVPTITSIFTDMKQVLPTPTRVLIGMSAFLKDYWWGILLAVGVTAVGVRHFRRTVKGRQWSDTRLLKLPLDERGMRRAAARQEWFAAQAQPLELPDIIAS